MRYGEQQSLSLLHDSFGLVLCGNDALVVAALSAYVAQRVHNQHYGNANGKQSQSRYLHHRSLACSHVGIDGTLHGIVFVRLYVLKHLPRAPCQLNAYELERACAVANGILSARVSPFYLVMYVGESLSHRVGNVDALRHGSRVGASALHCRGYGVRALSAEGVAQSAEESASGAHDVVHRLAVAGTGYLVRMNHHRVASALQVVHLACIHGIARSVGKDVEHHHGVVALGTHEIGERVHTQCLHRVSHKLLELHSLALRLGYRRGEAVPLPCVAHHHRAFGVGSVEHAVYKTVYDVASLHESLRSSIESRQRARTVVHHLRCEHEHNGKNGIAGDYLQT